MDTQALQAFLAIGETGSFSHAGERLHLTQPAVSKRIAALEEQLDCKLFDRVGRAVSLTEAGRALLPGARRILGDVADTLRDIQELGGRVGGRLSLGISHQIGLHRLPPVLKAFSRRYPEVRLDIDFLDSEQVCEQVAQGQLELGVITLAPDAPAPLQQFTVWQDRLLICTAPDHPLALARQADGGIPGDALPAISLLELSAHRAILPGLTTYTGQIIKRLFQAADLPLDVGMSTHYLETIKMMVSIGLGWSVLPTTLIDSSLRPFSITGHQLHRDLGCVRHERRSLSNAGRAFIEQLRAIPGPP